MLRIRVQTSEAAVLGYFAGSAGEYYADGPDAGGVWGGKAAEKLRLSGAVAMAEFAAVCGNRHPKTGESLTPRTKAVRRVGWDVNFHAPKSVSVLFGLTGDREILAAFREAVSKTMADLERDARTRVRGGGADADRVTGNLAWATFVHATARPVDGTPDPHLHAHAFVFNTTHDPVEGRLKAVQPEGVYRDARYFEACFHSRLAAGLRELGYDTHRTAAGWEVAGLPADLLRRFSRRTEVIERVAAEQGSPVGERASARNRRPRSRRSRSTSWV